MSCFNPRMKKIPTDEWFCYSCLKKKRKILKEIDTRKSPSIASEMGRCRHASAKGESNPIMLMLRDTEPYKTAVRAGKGFQAEVPDWSGAIIEYVLSLIFKSQPFEANSFVEKVYFVEHIFHFVMESFISYSIYAVLILYHILFIFVRRFQQ